MAEIFSPYFNLLDLFSSSWPLMAWESRAANYFHPEQPAFSRILRALLTTFFRPISSHSYGLIKPYMQILLGLPYTLLPCTGLNAPFVTQVVSTVSFVFFLACFANHFQGSSAYFDLFYSSVCEFSADFELVLLLDFKWMLLRQSKNRNLDILSLFHYLNYDVLGKHSFCFWILLSINVSFLRILGK